MGALDLVNWWPVDAASAGVLRRTDAGGGGATVVDGVGDIERPFAWASITKLLVAMAVLVAVEEGTVSLDEPAGPPGSTIRHLLAHASGLGPDSPVPVAGPGRMRIYSNIGFEILADILAERSHMSFPAYLAGGVINPLHMSGTALTPGSSAASGAEGPVHDLLSLAAELLAPSIVSRATLAEATSVAFPGLRGVLPGYGRFDPCDWGLGVEVRGGKDPHWTGTRTSPATFGHFGRAGGFLWVDPLIGLACATLSNRDFGPWAVTEWSTLADAVVEQWTTTAPATAPSEDSRPGTTADAEERNREAARAEAEAVAHAETERLEREAVAQAERLERQAAAQAETERLEREAVAQAETERLEREAVAQAETERLEREAVAQAETERLEREAVAQAEAERLERQAAARAEAERLERQAAARAEAERLERQAAARAEAERLERQAAARAEAERLERQAAARAEAERLERQAVAQAEAERLEREAAAQAEAEAERQAVAQAESANAEQRRRNELEAERLERQAADLERRKAAEAQRRVAAMAQRRESVEARVGEGAAAGAGGEEVGPLGPGIRPSDFWGSSS